MLTSVVITNQQGINLTLPIQDTSGGYEIRDIQGLDPVDAEIISSVVANLDGEQEQSSRRGKRNIIFKLGYSTPNVRERRKNLYGFFMPKAKVRMRFYADDLPMLFMEINGTVESCNSPLFAKEPEATISIICVDPDFYDPNPVVWNDSTTPYDPYMPIDYQGDVDTGFVMTMDVDRTLTAFTMYHKVTPNGSVDKMLFSEALAAGDRLTFSTIPGSKGIYRTRGGNKVSILYGLNPDSTWTTLVPGMNYLRISSGGAPIPYSISFTNKYGGL